MGPTLTDVARHADVALSTASRAFSEPSRLGPSTLRKILAVAQELGYTPSVRPVERSSTRTVAVVVPDIADPLFAGFVKAVQKVGWHQRHTIVVADSDADPDRERAVIAHLTDRVDGIVLCSPQPGVELTGRVPVVLVDREAPGVDCVVTDATEGLAQTVDYLTALGHRRIAYVPGSPRSWSSEHRVAVVRALAAEHDLELDVLGWQPETVAGGTAAAARVVASGASAVIAHNDLVALGVISGARALGVLVPEDLSVIGMDDIPFAALHPGLTSIAAPVARAGELSLELLGHAGTPRTVRLPTHLVVRASTGPIRSG